MDQAAKYEMSHFGGEYKAIREKPRPQRQKPFSKKSFEPGHYAPAEQTKEGLVCYYCKKPGHFKRNCKKLKSDKENDKPHQ
eukprot:jgi/Phyca11/113967/e_gw1.25.631.1